LTKGSNFKIPKKRAAIDEIVPALRPKGFMLESKSNFNMNFVAGRFKVEKWSSCESKTH